MNPHSLAGISEWALYLQDDCCLMLTTLYGDHGYYIRRDSSFAPGGRSKGDSPTSPASRQFAGPVTAAAPRSRCSGLVLRGAAGAPTLCSLQLEGAVRFDRPPLERLRAQVIGDYARFDYGERLFPRHLVIDWSGEVRFDLARPVGDSDLSWHLIRLRHLRRFKGRGGLRHWTSGIIIVGLCDTGAFLWHYA